MFPFLSVIRRVIEILPEGIIMRGYDSTGHLMFKQYITEEQKDYLLKHGSHIELIS